MRTGAAFSAGKTIPGLPTGWDVTVVDFESEDFASFSFFFEDDFGSGVGMGVAGRLAFSLRAKVLLESSLGGACVEVTLSAATNTIFAAASGEKVKVKSD